MYVDPGVRVVVAVVVVIFACIGLVLFICNVLYVGGWMFVLCMRIGFFVSGGRFSNCVSFFLVVGNVLLFGAMFFSISFVLLSLSVVCPGVIFLWVSLSGGVYGVLFSIRDVIVGCWII